MKTQHCISDLNKMNHEVQVFYYLSSLYHIGQVLTVSTSKRYPKRNYVSNIDINMLF